MASPQRIATRGLYHMAHVRPRGNKWVGVVELPRDPITGKRRQKWVSADTEDEARAKCLEIEYRLLKRDYFDPSTLPLATYLRRDWLDAHDWKPNTWKTFNNAIQHIEREIGHITLADLRPSLIQAFHRRLAERGLSPASIQSFHNTLRTALEQAVRLEMIPSNPARAVRPPRLRRVPMTYWTQEQFDAFLERHTDHPHWPLWLLAGYTGARKSELLGLKWEYVDLAARTIRIEHNLVRYPDGRHALEDVKRPRSRRTIPLRRRALEVLNQHRKDQLTRRMAQANAWSDLGMVFDRGDGHYLTQAVVSHHFIKAVRASKELPYIRFHDLRHTAATRMIALGMSIFEVSRILGHASTAMTTDIYGHLALDTLQASIDRLDEREEGLR